MASDLDDSWYPEDEGEDEGDEPEQLVDACPECESSQIRVRVSLPSSHPKRHICVECDSTFVDPIQRPPLPSQGNYSDAGDYLRQADPEDFPPDADAEARGGPEDGDDDEIPPPDGTVLVSAATTSRTSYHLADEEGRPICGQPDWFSEMPREMAEQIPGIDGCCLSCLGDYSYNEAKAGDRGEIPCPKCGDLIDTQEFSDHVTSECDELTDEASQSGAG